MKTKNVVITVVVAFTIITVAVIICFFILDGILLPGERIDTATTLLTEDEKELSQTEIEEIGKLLRKKYVYSPHYNRVKDNVSVIPVLTLKTSYGRIMIESYNFCRNGLKKKRAECISKEISTVSKEVHRWLARGIVGI